MFSRQLFKAIQPVSHWQMNGNVRLALLSPALKKDCLLSFLGDLPEVSLPRWGGVLLGVGERTDSVVFSHALLSVETLVYVRIPKCPPHI